MIEDDDFEDLLEAHRALAAQHTALMAVCRVMLPIIPADAGLVRRMLTTAYDAYTDHMDNHGQDADYQRMVRDGIDLLSRAVLAGHTPPPPSPENPK